MTNQDSPKKRGAKKGSTREGSLVTKLLALAVGDHLYLDDTEHEDKPTLMERNVGTVSARSPALEGRRFSTERWVGVQQTPAVCRPLLCVKRIG